MEFIVDHDTRKMGRIVELDEDKAVIQVFEGTENMSLDNTPRGLRDIRWKLPCQRKCWAVHLTGLGKQSMALDRSTDAEEAGCKRTSAESGQTGNTEKLYPYRNLGN